MFKINFKDLSTQLSPHFFRQPIYLKYLFSLIKPLSDINDNGNPVMFFNQGNLSNTEYKGIYSDQKTYSIGNRVLFEGVAYKNIVNITTPEAFTEANWIRSTNRSFFPLTIFITRFLQVDASRLKLQKYLNELWDSTNEGILIVNNPTVDVLYRFNNAEQHDDEFDYNAWDSTVDYAATGEFVLANDGNVYESNTNPNLNNEPPSAEWDLISTAKEYMFNEADEYTADYTVKIPILVTLQPDYSNDRFKAELDFFNAAGRTYQGVKLETNEFLFSNV